MQRCAASGGIYYPPGSGGSDECLGPNPPHSHPGSSAGPPERERERARDTLIVRETEQSTRSSLISLVLKCAPRWQDGDTRPGDRPLLSRPRLQICRGISPRYQSALSGSPPPSLPTSDQWRWVVTVDLLVCLMESRLNSCVWAPECLQRPLDVYQLETMTT